MIDVNAGDKNDRSIIANIVPVSSTTTVMTCFFVKPTKRSFLGARSQ